jgi:uncharacterized membrane protein
MTQTLKLFGSLLVLIFVLDLAWIGVCAKGFYDRELGNLARRKDGRLAPLIWPIVVVYLLMPAGILAFVLPRAVGVGLAQQAGWGAAFGAMLYGLYDFTNYALLAGWTLRMVVVDVVWGAFLCAVSTVLAVWLNSSN